MWHYHLSECPSKTTRKTPSLIHVLANGSYDPLGEFPMFLPWSQTQTQISPMPVSDKPLPSIVCPSVLGLYELVSIVAQLAPHPALGRTWG